MNIYKELGIQRLAEDPDLLASLKKYVAEKAHKVIPGYSCNYLLYTFPGNLEFEYCRTLDGKDAGFDIHFCGSYYTGYFRFVKVLNGEGTAPVYQMTSYESSELLPVRVVCPDTRPPASYGCLYYGQVAAFAKAGSFRIADEKNCSVKPLDGTYTVLVTGEVIETKEGQFEFESVHAAYYNIKLKTSIGNVNMLVSRDVGGIPEEGSFVQAVCMLSLDVAVKPESYDEGPFRVDMYKGFLPEPDKGKYYVPGFIPDMENDIPVLCHALENRDFRRIARICQETVTVSDDAGNHEMDLHSLEGFLLRIARKGNPVFRRTHCISAKDPDWLGLQGIEIMGQDSVRCVLLFEGNEYGQIARIFQCPPESCSLGRDSELYALVQLKAAMCCGRIQLLKAVLSENCTYRSDYSGRTMVGARKIMDFLSEVWGNLDESNQYTGEIVPSADVLRECAKRPSAYSGSWCFVERQLGEIAAVIFIRVNDRNRITNILLSRNGRYVTLFEPVDKPAESMLAGSVRGLLHDFYGGEDPVGCMRKQPAPDDDENGIYVWKNADQYARSWMNNNGYICEDTIPEDDCIAYHCSWKDEKWVLYLFASGEGKRVALDTEYCVGLKNRESAENRKVVLIGMTVEKTEDDEGKTQIAIRGYNTKHPESWILSEVNGQDIVLFYPRRDVFEMLPRMMAAVNTRDGDLLDALFAGDGYLEDMNGGHHMNYAYFTSIVHRVKEYGKLRVAYVSFDGFVYSKVPYIEDYCYLKFSVNDQHKIERITEVALDCSYADFLVTDEIPLHDPRNDTPRLIAVEAFPPSAFSRLSLRLVFDNNEIRRYDFKGDFGEDEVFSVMGYTFTDKMFSRPRLTDHHTPAKTLGNSYFAENGQGVEFVNGFSVGTVSLYFDSYPIERFSYADMDNVHMLQFDYDEDGFGVGRISNLDPRNPLYLLDRNTMTARTLPEKYWNTSIIIEPFCGGYSEGRIMVSTLSDLHLQYHHNLYCCAGMWGWLDKDFNEVIPPQYVYALNFVDGQAIVCKGEWNVEEKEGEKSYWCEHEAWGVIDRDGNQVVPCAYDELHAVDGTSRYYLIHEGGWENGHQAVYDTERHETILELDFEFDGGYMFNECFVTDRNILVFMDHQPGEGLDYLYAYDLNEGKYIAYKEESRERTYNGQSRVVVNRDGKDIIVF